MTELIEALIEGKKYRVTHRSETQKKDRQSVMRFLGAEGSNLIWSARPVAGTQSMPRSWFRSADLVLESTDPYINRVEGER